MIYNFDEVIPRRPTDSSKWNHYEPDVLPMWVADMDFRSPEPVIQALRDRVENGIFGYPSFHHDLSNLPEVLVERMWRLYRWQISPDDLLFIPGVVPGINLVCQALAQPDAGVLIQTPVYMPFLRLAGNAGMLAQEMELTRGEAGDYSIDWDLFTNAFTAQTRLFVLCNPHNPIGRVYSKGELTRLAEICLKRGVVICSDEIHCDLLFSGQTHTPIASLDPEIAHHTVTLMAPSKTYNIAGLQCSFAIVPDPKLRDKIKQAGKGLTGWVNMMGLVAALAAYRDGQEWLDQVLLYLEANRNYLANFVAEYLPGVQMWRPEGTYLAWLDCRCAGLPCSPGKFFLQQARVALNDGPTFGKGGEGYARMNFACPRSTLHTALERMQAALQLMD